VEFVVKSHDDRDRRVYLAKREHHVRPAPTAGLKRVSSGSRPLARDGALALPQKHPRLDLFSWDRSPTRDRSMLSGIRIDNDIDDEVVVHPERDKPLKRTQMGAQPSYFV
jgi:hypothetical protein